MSLLEKNVTLPVTWLPTYGCYGNLATAEYQNGSLVRQYKWVYTWNPRNQMTLAEKFGTTDSTYAGKVAYVYCLSCDGALSQRIEYSTTSSTTITSWRRYEYDGLNLLRVDERYDSAGGTIDANDYWRIKEMATHKPGSLGNMLGKKVYNYSSTNYTDTPTSSAFYAYHYDAVGNVLWVTDSGGVLSHSFSQDAFGNALATGNFSGTTWSAARTVGITEHQTGKWIDSFTGLYFFHARWYDSGVGRFVSKYPFSYSSEGSYQISMDLPTCLPDVTGLLPVYLDTGSCFGGGGGFGGGWQPPDFNIGNDILVAICTLSCLDAKHVTNCIRECVDKGGPPSWGGPPFIPDPNKPVNFVPQCYWDRVRYRFGQGCPNSGSPIRGRMGGFRCDSGFFEDELAPSYEWGSNPIIDINPTTVGAGVGVIAIGTILYYIGQSFCYAPLFAL